jgi:hypothetical protein
MENVLRGPVLGDQFAPGRVVLSFEPGTHSLQFMLDRNGSDDRRRDWWGWTCEGIKQNHPLIWRQGQTAQVSQFKFVATTVPRHIASVKGALKISRIKPAMPIKHQRKLKLPRQRLRIRVVEHELCRILPCLMRRAAGRTA